MNSYNSKHKVESLTLLEKIGCGVILVVGGLFFYQFVVFHANRSCFDDPRDGIKLFGKWEW